MFSAPWTETESRFVSMCLSVSAPWTEISDADSLTLFNEQKMFITSDPWPVFRVALSLVLFSSLSHWTAQNVLSVKASLWTLTHLRYSQINSHPHSRGHEATVIRLTPSHMYTHTHKHICKHKSLFPVLELKNLEPVLSLSLSLGLSWPTSLLKGLVPHFYPHHSFMKHLFERVVGSLLCQVFFVIFFLFYLFEAERWLREKPSDVNDSVCFLFY